MFGFLRNDENFDNLEELNLSHNRIEILPRKFFQKVYNVIKFDISFNNLEEVADEFLNLKRLTTLDITGNLITEIPLFINKTKISEIKFDWANYTELKSGPLRTVSHQTFSRVSTIHNANTTKKLNMAVIKRLFSKIKPRKKKSKKPEKTSINFQDYSKFCKFLMEGEETKVLFRTLEKALQR